MHIKLYQSMNSKYTYTTLNQGEDVLSPIFPEKIVGTVYRKVYVTHPFDS